MGMFVLYSFQEDAFWRVVPGTRRAKELEDAWREHPLFANSKDPLDGLINPDDYEKGLEEAWERAKPAGSTVLVILPPLTPAFIKEDVLQMLVEHLGFARAAAIESVSVALQSPGLVALLQQNPSPCCTVLNVGFSCCFAQPSIEGLAVESAGRRLNIGGRVLTNLLVERLKLWHFNLSESWLLVEDILKRTGEVLRNLDAALDNDFSGVAPLTYVLPDFEEDMTGFVQDQGASGEQDAEDATSFGRQRVTLTAERVVIPEALFRPQDHGLPLCGLPELVYAAILAVPEETWRPHFGRVVLCGGLARLPGLASRLRLDLRQLLPSHWPVEVIVEEEPELSFWRGAAQHALNSDEVWDEARQRSADTPGRPDQRRMTSDRGSAGSKLPQLSRRDLSIPSPATASGTGMPGMSLPHKEVRGQSDLSLGGSSPPRKKGKGKGKTHSVPQGGVSSGRRISTATIVSSVVNRQPAPASESPPLQEASAQPEPLVETSPVQAHGSPAPEAEATDDPDATATVVDSTDASNNEQPTQSEHVDTAVTVPSVESTDGTESAVGEAPVLLPSASEDVPDVPDWPPELPPPSDASPASSSPGSGLDFPDLPADLREEGFWTWTPTRKRLKRKAPASDYVQLRKGTAD
ncbi:ARP6 [Symbiodinium natans]|uniref:ARP6 protein n=1 Tax=Symbiodinium natans TaxID=878477 RepID=A0A812SYP3_9DINO|nr:ARP6 [Symbiodinium natans]